MLAPHSQQQEKSAEPTQTTGQQKRKKINMGKNWKVEGWEIKWLGTERGKHCVCLFANMKYKKILQFDQAATTKVPNLL